MTPTLDRLNYGAPITPTFAEMLAAYERNGDTAPSDLDPARGIIRAAVLSLATFATVAWVMS